MYFNRHDRKKGFCLLAVVFQGEVALENIENLFPLLWFDEHGEKMQPGFFGSALLKLDDQFPNYWVELGNFPLDPEVLEMLKNGQAEELRRILLTKKIES